MRFNCDKFSDWRYKKYLASQEWHRWFAWYPVRLGYHDCRWFEWVERRWFKNDCWDHDYWAWEYRRFWY